MAIQKLDQAKLAAFEQKMLGIVNNQATGLLVSVGHQVGLFDAMARVGPATSEQIASASKLNERYVREWLGGMVVSHIVEYDPTTATYVLPAEHAARTTGPAALNNMARATEKITALSHLDQGIVESFRNGGGVPYAAFSRLRLQQRTDPDDPAALFGSVLPLVPGLSERLKTGIDVADIGCGNGGNLILMAQEFPASRFTGYDFTEPLVTNARGDAQRTGVTNVHFELKDVATLDAVAQFDLITAFDTIHDQAQPAEVLRRIANALRPGGTFFMVDIGASSKLEENIDHPMGPFLFCYSVMHCMTVSLALNGTGLGTMWGRQKAEQMLAEAGFDRVEVKRLDSDTINNYYVCSRS